MTTSVARRFTSSWSAIRFVSCSANDPPIPMPARVDEHVHAAEALGVGRDDANALVRVAEIRRDGERVELARRLLEWLRAASDERELVPVLPKRAGESKPDPGRPTGDERRWHARASLGV